jgi:hypothetical protein
VGQVSGFFLIPAGEVYYTRTRTNRGDVLSWLLFRTLLFRLREKNSPFKIVVVINYFKLVDNPHNTAGFLNILYLRKLTC